MNPDARRMFVIDVEASGLPPGAYPIEIAICDVATGETATWLICPAADWAMLAWDTAAERLHGITQAKLKTEGRPVVEVYAELIAALGSSMVFSDSAADHAWLGALARAADRPWFDLELLDIWPELERLSDGKPSLVVEAIRLSQIDFPKEHSAVDDAARWAKVIRLLRDRNPLMAPSS